MPWGRVTPSWCLAVVVLLWYIVVRLLTLEMTYIEGDDASIVVHHALGRDTAIQPPFAVYQIGFDRLLNWFPANEHTIRTVSYEVTFLSGWLILFMIGRLMMLLLPAVMHGNLIAFVACLPLVQPEWVFNTLIINPTNLGMAICLIGLIGIFFLRSKHKYIALLFAGICFAVGIYIRWSLLAFAPIVLLFYVAVKYSQTKMFKFEKSDALLLAVLPLTVLCLILLLFRAGLHPNDFVQTIFWGIDYGGEHGVNHYSQFILLSSWATPAFVVVFFRGLVKLPSRIVLFASFSLVMAAAPFFVSGWDASFKYLITMVPVVSAIMFFGFHTIVQTTPTIKTLFFFLVLLPWIIGLQFPYVINGYGVGFQRYDVPVQIADVKTMTAPNNMRFLDVQAVFKTGVALPTIEGVRPFWGYSHAVFFGDWKTFHRTQNEYIHPIIRNTTVSDSVVVLQDGGSNMLKAMLLKNDFALMSYDLLPTSFEKWTFEKSEKHIVLYIPHKATNSIHDYVGNTDFLYFGGFSKLMNYISQTDHLNTLTYHNSWLLETATDDDALTH